jgi:hypothetical protein
MFLGGSNDCKNVGLDVLVLAKGGYASHFVGKTPAKKKGEIVWKNLGGKAEGNVGQTQTGSHLSQVENALYTLTLYYTCEMSSLHY